MNEFAGFITSDDNLFNSCQFPDELQNFHLHNSQITFNVTQEHLPSMPFSNDIQNLNYCSTEDNIISNINLSSSIPFVRIHAFENRSASGVSNLNRNQNDIKAEPIKSELSDAQCNSQATQPTQTPPASGLTTPAFATEITNALTTICSSTLGNEIALTQPTETTITNQINKPNPPLLLKCAKCLFLCISQTNLDIHVSSSHDENSNQVLPNRISCPGCENIFISKKSLKFHLEYDHIMLSDDLENFLENIPDEGPPPADTSKKKSRIYLKNVDCLREKSFTDNVEVQSTLPNIDNSLDKVSIDHANERFNDEYDFIDLINDENQTPPITSSLEIESPVKRSKQKITIKSVETLQEPIYQDIFYNSNNTHNTESFNVPNTQVYYNMDTGFSTTTTQSSNVNTNNDFILHNHFEDFQKTQINQIDSIEKEKRPPKIYIKNVDILKEPIYLPSTNVSSILHVNETLSFNDIFTPPPAPNVPVVHQRLPITPISIQSHLNVPNSSGSLTSKSQHFPIVNSTQIPKTFSNTCTFPYTNQDQTGSNQPKSKIYIKNVDILKQPQFQDNGKKSTNFLHLRTVDELNLLDKTELNIMNNLNSNDKPQTENGLNPSSENSKNSDLENNSCTYDPINSNYNQNSDNNFQCTNNVQAASIQVSSNWDNQDYGGFDSLDNFIDSNTNTTISLERRAHQSQQYFDLNTPQRCDISFDEVMGEIPNNAINQVDDENDLFVCSDNLIPYREISNSSFNPEQISIDLDSNLMIDTELNEINENNITNNSNKDGDQINSSEKEKLDLLTKPVEINPQNLNSTEIEKSNCDKNISLEVVKQNEKGRIYVSENLMEDRGKINSNSINDYGQKRPKGRPFGAKTQKRKTGCDSNDNSICAEYRCDRLDCGFRFKEAKTLEYHKLCHSMDKTQLIQCPECKSSEFTTWNTLHTHLWRSHNIDMELYSCDQCNFKTPILSRLLNTHSKIHSNERNFKCEVCEKAFKNSRQLKNHRRIHRKYSPDEIELVKCEECSAMFASKKSLKQHVCPNNKTIVEEAKCSICGKICSSKSYLKIHLAIHDTNSKYICDCGEFSTNNPSSFRKHKARHSDDNNKTYQCQYCDYQTIQASLYKKHLNKRHPEEASNIIHQCKFCKFSTIRRLQYYVHLAKNHNVDVSNLENKSENENILAEKNLNSQNNSITSTDDKLNNVNSNANENCEEKVDVDIKSDQFLIQNINEGVT